MRRETGKKAWGQGASIGNNPEMVQQVVAQLPWTHTVRLIESVKDHPRQS
jgi:hypothetical protein